MARAIAHWRTVLPPRATDAPQTRTRCSRACRTTATPTTSAPPAASRSSPIVPKSRECSSPARSSATRHRIVQRSASRRSSCCSAISTAPRARSMPPAAARATRTSRSFCRTPSLTWQLFVSASQQSICNQQSAMKTARSSRLFTRAQAILPGGVDSPVRAFKSVGAAPLFIRRGAGSRIEDVDGNTFVDYVMSWGPLIHGHAARGLVKAVAAAAKDGTSFGAPSALEVALGEKVRALMPSIERVRFVSSGTEAAMSAVRVARAATGRDRILKFEGCYHGHADAFLVKAGSGALTLGTPTSPGVTRGTSADTLVAAYNNLDSVRQLFDANRDQIAAVIVEPIAGNMGLVPPADGFLSGLRELTRAAGALLIFDEVISGFRAAAGGAQASSGVRPDLTCLGKIIGGGLPVGAYGGRADLMDLVAPAGPVYQAGTLSGNPLAMTAGILGLRQLLPRLFGHPRTLGTRLPA